MIIDTDLLSIQQARILAENAREAQRRMAALSQETLDGIVEAVADAVLNQARELAVMSQEETDFGCWQDKLVKNRFVCTQMRARLRGLRCVGIIAEDAEQGSMDIGVPMGVIAALVPATSPVSTTVSTALLALKSGNAIVFSPHPRAARSIARVLEIMTRAAHAHGLPEGGLSCLGTVTRSGTEELLRHPATSLIMITAVPGLLRAARATGKPLIYGGRGNGPAFVERSADIDQAARDIISSKTFDHGTAPSTEQALVVETCVAPAMRQALLRHGAYFLTTAQAELLGRQLCPGGRANTGLVGLDAPTLAQRAGFEVPAQVRILIAERTHVTDADPYAGEILAPVLTWYVEDDWQHACEKCIELLLREREAHTLVIHSRDEAVIRQFALKKPVARLLVNTPAAFGGMGLSTNLFPAMTLGSGSAGFGITADNVSPLHLIYVRKVGRGVRASHDAVPDTPTNTKALQDLLLEAIRVLDGTRPA